MYSFNKNNGAAIITSTDGSMWATTEGACLHFDNATNKFRLDFNVHNISFGCYEIERINGSDDFKEKDVKEIFRLLIAIFA
jgi:hypothetical protein